MQEIRKAIIRKTLQELDALTAFELLLGKKSIASFEEFVEVISRDTYALIEVVSIPHAKMTTLLTLIFPDRIPKQHTKITKYILSLNGLRECKKCNSILEEKFFRPNVGRSDSMNGQCKDCQSKSTARTQAARQAAYKAAKLNRTPSWANLDEISKIYINCPIGMHVDHIIPLQGKEVSGLHVSSNLQYLTPEENIRKHNHYIAG